MKNIPSIHLKTQEEMFSKLLNLTSTLPKIKKTLLELEKYFSSVFTITENHNFFVEKDEALRNFLSVSEIIKKYTIKFFFIILLLFFILSIPALIYHTYKVYLYLRYPPNKWKYRKLTHDELKFLLEKIHKMSDREDNISDNKNKK